MQVNLDLAISVTGDSIIINDNTDYGVGQIPARSLVKVEYKLFYLPHASSEEASSIPGYGFYTVTNLIIPNRSDGHYRVEAYATHDGDVTDVKEEVFVFDSFSDCVADAKAVFENCSVDDTDDVFKFLKLDAIESAITDLINAKRYEDAQCNLQKGQNLCEDENCKEC